MHKIATLKDVSVADFFTQTNRSVKQYEAYKEILANNPELAKKLSDPNLSLAEKQIYQNQLKTALEQKLGYSLANEVKTISTDEKGEAGKDIKGFISTENNNIYSNDKNQKSTVDTVYTLGQELAAGMQVHDGVDITTNRDQHNAYQDSIAQDTVNDISFVLSNNGYNEMASTNNHVGSIGQTTTSPSIFNSQTSNNNIEFSGLDKEQGDNNPALIFGALIGAGTDLYSQYKRNGDNLTLKNIDWIELGVNTATGAWSGGASSIGGAIIRGGVAAGVNEGYNQVVNEKSNSLEDKIKEVTKAGVLGGLTGYGIGKAGNLGNQIIRKSEQIGQPLTTGAKTYKLPAETAAGITGAIAPQISKDGGRDND